MTSMKDFYKAAETGDIVSLEKCIGSVENIDEPDTDNLTALGKAAYGDQPDAVQFLLNARASSSVQGKNDQTLIQWAREQKENDNAKIIMLYDYMDRLYATSQYWEKAKRHNGVCDICSASITESDSFLISADDVFSSEKYKETLYKQTVDFGKTNFSDLKTKEEILEYLEKQIRNYNENKNYMVCSACAVRFFQQLIFGFYKDYLEEAIDQIINKTDPE